MAAPIMTLYLGWIAGPFTFLLFDFFAASVILIAFQFPKDVRRGI
jgi:hypothetical protein